MPLQAKLLHVLQSGEFSRLGGEDVKVNTWVITATNHDLARDLNDGRFREDLYYRLNIIKVDVPPLRERREDIPLLVDYYVNKYSSELNIAEDPAIDSEMMGLFLQYNWPGNVRELSNTIKRLMVMGDRESILQQMFPETESISVESQPAENGIETRSGFEEILPLKLLKAKASDYIEKGVIAHALNIAGGNKVKAAKMLNISYKALFYKMKDLGLR